jgi:hypothetical protein
VWPVKFPSERRIKKCVIIPNLQGMKISKPVVKISNKYNTVAVHMKSYFKNRF